MPRLVITRCPHVGREYTLDAFPVVLGRAEDAGVKLRDLRASRHHARIVARDGHFVVEDLQSRNGTRLNDNYVRSSRLADGDRIVIGDTEMLFRMAPEEVTTPLHDTYPPDLIPAPTTARTSLVIATPGVEPALSAVIDARGMGLEDLPSGPGGLKARSGKAHSRLRTMIEVSTQLATIHDIGELLDEIMNSLFSIFPQAERGFVLLRQEDGAMVPEVVRRAAGDGEERITVSSTVLRRVVDEKSAVLVHDAAQDTELGKMESIVNFRIKSMMVAPLLYQGEVLGAVHIDTTRSGLGFDQEDLSLLTGVSCSAAIALKNAMLLQNVAQEAAMRTALARHLSPDLVEQFIRGELELGKLGGDMKRGTIFFCDIIGFTRIAERMDPHHVVDLLNRFFARMEEVIFRYRGTIDKFAGDSIMAYWGVLLEDPSSTRDAVTAALEMQNALDQINAELRAQGRTESLGMGIGLNTGPVVAGNVGSVQKIEYTLIGDSVNLAQRIEHMAGRGQVLVGESTYADVADLVAAVRLKPIAVRGREQAIVPYVLRAIADPADPEGRVIASLPVTLVADDGEVVDAQLVRATLRGGRVTEVALNAPRALPAGTRWEARPYLPEYPGVGTFSLRVVGSSSGGTVRADTQPGVGRLGEYTAALVSQEAPIATLLRPGMRVDSDAGPDARARE
jgi:adenylate cyclase